MKWTKAQEGSLVRWMGTGAVPSSLVRELYTETERLRAEVERLEEARQNAMNWGIEKDKDLARRVDEYSALLAQERAEVERLTGLVTTATVEAAKAQKENARLRALEAYVVEDRAPPPGGLCRAWRCQNQATHGPVGEAIVCWEHAGDWERINDSDTLDEVS